MLTTGAGVRVLGAMAVLAVLWIAVWVVLT